MKKIETIKEKDEKLEEQLLHSLYKLKGKLNKRKIHFKEELHNLQKQIKKIEDEMKLTELESKEVDIYICQLNGHELEYNSNEELYTCTLCNTVLKEESLSEKDVILQQKVLKREKTVK